MKSCASPFGHTSNPVFFVTNVILLPIFVGIGGVGNLINIVVLNRSYIRTQSPVFVYLTGLAVLDLLNLLLTLPGLLKDIGVLSVEVGYSPKMAHFSTIEYGFSNICNHASVWIIGFVCVVHFMKTFHGRKKIRWIRISASRIIVFVIVLCCIVVDFPRFFELRVAELKGHCFNLSLWHWEFTEFGKISSYTDTFPWVVSISCFLLPYFLAILFGTILVMRLKFWKQVKTHCRRKSSKPAYPDREYQTHLVLAVIVVSFLILELPYASAQIALGLGAHIVKTYDDFLLISRCLSLLHSSITFFLFLALSEDFRKSMSRTFCSCCNTDDEYYEPLTCAQVLAWFKPDPSSEENSEYGSYPAEGHDRKPYADTPSFTPASAYSLPPSRGKKNQQGMTDKPIWV